jgi:hypothetical protein
MTFSSAGMHRSASLLADAGHSSVGAWLKAALMPLFSASNRVQPAPRDLVREASQVRARAESVRRTDRRFADDLFAAADRHETQGL